MKFTFSRNVSTLLCSFTLYTKDHVTFLSTTPRIDQRSEICFWASLNTMPQFSSK